MRTVSKDQNDEHRYDDMLLMKNHISKNHPRMSREQRAAQFSPFSALSGYEESITEAVRLTSQMIELSEEERENINRQLQYIKANMKMHPAVTITYFEQDLLKEGGSYRQITQKVKKIENDKIFLTDHIIAFEQIISIQIKTD